LLAEVQEEAELLLLLLQLWVVQVVAVQELLQEQMLETEAQAVFLIQAHRLLQVALLAQQVTAVEVATLAHLLLQA
jgi:hypothetical protein